jgi:hypothetical protein
MPIFGFGNNFGQRDPVIAALLLPILWLMLWPDFRRESCRALHRLAIAMAALAFCIKPQFVLPFAVWVAVAAYRHGWREALRRAGFGGLVLAGIGYIGFLLLAFPGYPATARLAIETYGAYRAPWAMVASGSILAMPLLAIAGLAAPRAGPARPLLGAAAIAGVSYILLALLELKPWFYHHLPAVLTPLAAIGVGIVAGLPRMMSGVVAPLALAALIPALLFLTAWHSQAVLWADYERNPLVRELRRDLAPGDPWAVISTTSLPAFPTTVIEGYRWVLRGPSLWPLPGALSLSKDSGAAIETAVAEGLAEDIEKGRPKLIVVDPRRNDLLPEGKVLDLLLPTPRFAAAWAHYRLARQLGGLDLYMPSVNR